MTLARRLAGPGRPRRLALLALVALALAPGTWLRSARVPPDTSQAVTFTPLAAAPRRFGEFAFLKAWQLDSRNSRFGGYSALVSLGEGRLLAASDSSGAFEFDPPDGPAVRPPRIGEFADQPGLLKYQADLEGLTRDPATGTLWASFESRNAINRFDARHRRERAVRPAAMRRWRGNSGPEAIVRLHDGRFIVLAERDPRWFQRLRPALLFARDPTLGGRPARFRFASPGSASPTDMAELPDGRVVILLRGWSVLSPMRFPTRLAVADPAEIRPGRVWRARIVADLWGAIPAENYEGVAVVPTAGGGATLWIISDDNGALFQSTRLLEFSWTPPPAEAGAD